MNKEEIISEYLSGATLTELGRRTGKSFQAVRRLLLDCGVELREDSPKTAVINKMYNGGMTVAEIARTLKMKERSVQVHLPHRKCSYAFDEPSYNAVVIRRCREKKKADAKSEGAGDSE